MSKTWEHYNHAARHHERAAHHYTEAATYDQAEEHEKAAHHAYLAHGYSQIAIQHDAEAARLHALECNAGPLPVLGADTGKKSAA